MAQRSGGFRRKTRDKLKKPFYLKGKIKIREYIKRLEIGDKVHLLLEPTIHKGMFFPRFHGRHGVVEGKQGSNYKISIKDGGKQKTLIVHPIHLRKVELIKNVKEVSEHRF